MRKRIFAYALSIIVLGASMIVPSFAGFAAGIEADSGDFAIANDVEGLYTGMPFTNDLFYSMSLCYQINFNESYPGQANYALAISRAPLAVERGARIGFAFVMDSDDYANGVSDPHYHTYVFSDVYNVDVCSAFRSPYVGYINGVVEFSGISSRVSDDIPCWYSTIPYRSTLNVRRSILEASGNYCYASLFNTLEEAASAFLEYGPASPSNSSLTASVPAGNALLIGFNSTVAVKVSTKFSYPGYRNRTFLMTNQQYHIYDYRLDDYHYTPSGLTNTADNIPFTPVAPFLADGSSYYGEWNYATSVHQSVKYMVIFNPMYVSSAYAVSKDDLTLNPTLSVSFSGNITEYRMIPMSTTGSILAGTAPSQSASGTIEDSYVGSSSPGSSVVEWTDPSGDPVVPVVGGLTDPDTETDQGFWAKLTNIFQGFTSIFTWSYEAINSLINSGSDFISHLGSLYTWLPPEVLSVLSSALVLVIVIGVVKVLL